MRIKKKDFVALVANRCDIPKKIAHRYWDIIVDIIEESVLTGKDVPLNTFGILKLKTRKGKLGHNPHTGERLAIPAKKYIKLCRTVYQDALLKTLLT